MNATEIINQLRWRYATKKLDASKRIPKEKLEALLTSLQLAPSSYGLQPYKFIIVSNQDLKEKLKVASFGQSQVADCSELVVITTLKNVEEKHVRQYADLVASERQLPHEKADAFFNVMLGDLVNGPRNKIIKWWAQRQAYIAIGFLLETAALLEVDACPMEGISPSQYDDLLNLKESDFSTVAVVALGFRTVDDKYQDLKKVRKESSDIFEFR